MTSSMWFKEEDYPFLKAIRDNHDKIKEEALRLMPQRKLWFTPCHTNTWTVIALRINENKYQYRKEAPVTCRILEKFPRIATYGFSIIEPRGDITPHSDPALKLVRGQYCLQTEEGQAGMTVLNETRIYTEGTMILFDEAYEHYAWNHSHTTPRLNLMFGFYPNASAQRTGLNCTECSKDFHDLEKKRSYLWPTFLKRLQRSLPRPT